MGSNDQRQIGSENKNIHHSFVVRCWRGADGELHGQLINPLVHRLIRFSSALELHQALNKVIETIPQASERMEDGGEQA